MFYNTVPYRKTQLTEMFVGSGDEFSAEVEICIKQNCLIFFNLRSQLNIPNSFDHIILDWQPLVHILECCQWYDDSSFKHIIYYEPVAGGYVSWFMPPPPCSWRQRPFLFCSLLYGHCLEMVLGIVPVLRDYHALVTVFGNKGRKISMESFLLKKLIVLWEEDKDRNNYNIMWKLMFE